MRIYIMTVCVLLSCFSTGIVHAEEKAIHVVESYIDTLNQNNWSAVPDFWVEQQQEDLLAFLENKQNEQTKAGLFNIQTARLFKWKKLPYRYAARYLPSRYMDTFTDKEVLYIAVDYRVHTENQYHINGTNYFLAAMAKEDGHWKLALTPLVPVSTLIQDGYGFGTKDEATFDQRRTKFVQEEGSLEEAWTGQ